MTATPAIVCLMIDPHEQTLTVQTFTKANAFNEAKELGGYDLADIRSLGERFCLVVDDEGLLKPNAYFSLGDDPQMLAGRAFMFGRDAEGEFTSLQPNMIVHLLDPANMHKHVHWYKTDFEAERAIKQGILDRPRSVFSSMGPDLKPVPGTETVLWSWGSENA
jgi:hypothetical protein